MPAGLVGRRQVCLGRKGTLGFIAPLIPDTSGSIPDTPDIRGLAQIILKSVFTLPIPFTVISQSKRYIILIQTE